MANPKKSKPKTKKVVWCGWSVCLDGKIITGRGQFSAAAYNNYMRPKDTEEYRNGLGHLASVVKGVLQKRHILAKGREFTLTDGPQGNFMIWLETEAGPEEIPRGRRDGQVRGQTKLF